MAKRTQKPDDDGLMICPVCGKRFIYNPWSVYRITKNGVILYMDGYSCFRKVGGGSFDSDGRRRNNR